MRAREVKSTASLALNYSRDEEDPNDGRYKDRSSRNRAIRVVVVRCANKIINAKTGFSVTISISIIMLLTCCVVVLRHRFRDVQRKGKFLQVVQNVHIQTATKIRHQCIEAIRRKHHEALVNLARDPMRAETDSILLVDPAYHENVGDHMLTVGEQTFLQRSGWNNSILECEYCQSAGKVPRCEKNLNKMAQTANLALWHAGGNWGDLWIDAQWARIGSFQELLQAGFTIVGMPQSLYYKEAAMEVKHTAMIQEAIRQGLKLTELESGESREVTRSRLIFTWREKASYEQGKRLYPFATNKLVPDIAFQLGPFEPIRPTKYEDMVDILVFLRDDYESKVKSQRHNGAIKELLNGIPGGKGLTFKIVDWKDRLTIFKTTNILFDQTSVKLLSMGKVVICDRLHAAILAYLSGIPFVYVDQVSSKLTNALSVALSSGEGCKDEHASMMTRAVSLQDALKKAVEFLNKYNLL